jgi:3-oxoacyl-[acyl-carrier protein] reductase
MNYVLKNKNCLITGATGALGQELARQLFSHGCNLFLTSRSVNKLKSLALEIDCSGHRIKYASFDLSNLLGIDSLIREVNSVFKVDILINSAGVFSINEIENVSDKDLDIAINVNVKSPYVFCKHFSKDMKDNRWGKIVNIGSSSSYSGFKKGTLYCATKHAILGLSRSLYEELKEYNVQVICVSPGSMQSEMAKISVDQDFNTFLLPSDVASQILNVLLMENNMTCNELRLNRFVIK